MGAIQFSRRSYRPSSSYIKEEAKIIEISLISSSSDKAHNNNDKNYFIILVSNNWSHVFSNSRSKRWNIRAQQINRMKKDSEFKSSTSDTLEE